MGSVSQLLRFTLPRSATRLTAFHALRDRVASKASVKTQYFGYVLRDQGFPVPKAENEMCWLIQWPSHPTLQKSKDFKTDLETVIEGSVRSLLFNFQETKDGEVEKGLEASVCQFAIINLVPDAPRFKDDFERSMHKTFTDCYLADGFIGGGWAYSLTSNDADGEIIEDSPPTELDDKDRRLAYYVIGWDTLEAHHNYAKTPLFDEEIDYLKPWFTKGSGAFYVKFEKHM